MKEDNDINSFNAEPSKKVLASKHKIWLKQMR